MSTYASIWSPDLTQSAGVSTPITNSVGSLATTTSSGVIQLGKHRLIRISFMVTPAAATIVGLRITFGLSTGTTAATPAATSMLLTNNQEIIFDTGETFDQMQLTNLAADNGSVTIAYTVTPLSKF
jgi:hypothetical protein